MKTQTENRDRILKAGAELIYRQGFHHTGIQQILTACAIPKGSFYYYFKSKSDFGLALIDHIHDGLHQLYDRFFMDETRSPVERLRVYFEWVRDYFAASGFTGGCPVGNLAQEMGDLDSDMQEKLASVIDGMILRIAEVLEEAREQGEIPAETDTAETARMIFACWEGALLHMKVVKSAAPLDTVLRYIFGDLLSAA